MNAMASMPLCSSTIPSGSEFADIRWVEAAASAAQLTLTASCQPVAGIASHGSQSRVICDGTDANAEMVRAGMAWVFDRYITDRGLYAVQDEARAQRRGLLRRSFTPHPASDST